jgi:trehalose synthase
VDVVSLVHTVKVPSRPVSLLTPVSGARRYAQLASAAGQLRLGLAGRTIWNVNSTAAGGGVAEMLQVLVGYVQDLGIAIGWLVITGDAGFFAITKRLHNQIHGSLSGAPLGAAEAAHYGQMLAANAVELCARVRPGDVVLLHDPQTAGLAAPLAQAGARVVWRCHIGVDWENDATRAGWDFLRPHMAAAEAYVFSRREYVPPWIPADKVWIIPPSIDPFSPKNQDLDPDTRGCGRGGRSSARGLAGSSTRSARARAFCYRIQPTWRRSDRRPASCSTTGTRRRGWGRPRTPRSTSSTSAMCTSCATPGCSVR